LFQKIWGAVRFLDCIYKANQIYNGKKFTFWGTNGPALHNNIFTNDAINQFDGKSLTIDVINDIQKRKSFLKYHWIYDAGAKAKVLEFYTRMDMRKHVMQTLFRHSSPYLIIQVHRDDIIRDTLHTLQTKEQLELRKPLKVKFIGEQGVDEGGVKKEFFQILVRELFHVDFGMFIYDKENDFFWFNLNTFEIQEFELIGMILGLAIYNNIILDIRFPNLVFKKLINKPLDFEDYRDFDPVMARGFEQLLEFEGDVEETYCRTFIHEHNFFDDIRTVDLKENGSEIPVTQENKKEYVELYSNYVMEKSVKRQFDMLKQGFELVADQENVQKYLDWEQLQLLICGSDKLDFEALQCSARYMDGFEEDSATIKFFWEIAHELHIDDKRKLLSFCTGSDRIPIRGLSELVLTISKNGEDESQLPTSHTCYNHLLLPEYKSKEVARKRLLTAIQNSEGFGLI